MIFRRGPQPATGAVDRSKGTCAPVGSGSSEATARGVSLLPSIDGEAAVDLLGTAASPAFSSAASSSATGDAAATGNPPARSLRPPRRCWACWLTGSPAHQVSKRWKR